MKIVALQIPALHLIQQAVRVLLKFDNQYFRTKNVNWFIVVFQLDGKRANPKDLSVTVNQHGFHYPQRQLNIIEQTSTKSADVQLHELLAFILLYKKSVNVKINCRCGSTSRREHSKMQWIIMHFGVGFHVSNDFRIVTTKVASCTLKRY